jgi:hypothetical protein
MLKEIKSEADANNHRRGWKLVKIISDSSARSPGKLQKTAIVETPYVLLLK